MTAQIGVSSGFLDDTEHDSKLKIGWIDHNNTHLYVSYTYYKASLNKRGWMELPYQINVEEEVEERDGWNCLIRSTQRKRWKGEVDGKRHAHKHRS